MSGGRFDYLQYRFTEIIDEIEQEVFDNPHEFSEAFYIIETAHVA